MATPTKKTKKRQVLAKRSKGWWRIQYFVAAADGVVEVFMAQGLNLDRAIDEIHLRIAARHAGGDR